MKEIQNDIDEGTTERMILTDVAADGGAAIWYRVGYPKPYASRRMVNGHAVLVVFADWDSVNMAALLAALEKSR